MPQKNHSICQSCGRPLSKESDFGTGKNGEKSREYCTHCFQGGEFTQKDLALKDQVEKHVNQAVSRYGISEEEARKQALKTLPKLKRWRANASGKDLKTKLIIPGILLLTAGITLFLININRSGAPAPSGGDANDSFPWISFLPIWIAVFIPIFAKQKDQPRISKEKKIIILAAALFLALALAGFIAFAFFSVRQQ